MAALDFPPSPTPGTVYGKYTWDGEKWGITPTAAGGGATQSYVDTQDALRLLKTANLSDVADVVTSRQNIYAAPFDALAYNGMQINGSMDVSQERGTTATTANNTYACDGWRIVFAGTMTMSSGIAANFGPGFTSYLYATNPTAQVTMGANDYVAFLHGIEGYRTARLGWGSASAQPVTIGFWSSHSPAGVYTGVVRNGAINRCYGFTYTQASSNVAQYNTITIPGDTTGTWGFDNTVGMTLTFAMACGATNTAPAANAWVAGSFLAAPGQVNGVAASNGALRITGVVILPGIEAPSAARSPLIMRPFDQELVTCQRYYTKTEATARYFAVAAGYNLENEIYWQVKMRSAPTLTTIAGAQSNISAVTANQPTISGARFGISSAAGGDFYAIQQIIIADARL